VKANVLRIGNLVMGNEPFEIDLYCLNMLNIYPDKYMPIQLNDEWFKKFGAKLDNNGNWWFDLIECYLEFNKSLNFYYPTYGQAPEFSHMEENRIGLRCIQYVHELQNLYFTLTGTELKY